MPEFSYERAMEHLVAVIQRLSLARNLDTIMSIVRHAARELTGAHGATFVLRDNDLCYYADEDAISPLWKGQRFPMTSCISGWAMLNRRHAVIEDIYTDPRIPAQAYRPTFVKSLVMVPIRTEAPIGAIGNYWATIHRANDEEVKVLQALADSTSVAMENVQLYSELEQRVRQRTAQLENLNKELETFSYSVSHDLRAPLRSIDGFGRVLEESVPSLNDEASDALRRMRAATRRMGTLIDDLLKLSRVAAVALHPAPVDLSKMAGDIIDTFKREAPGRDVNWLITPAISAVGDAGLLRIVLENLLGNAWKFSSHRTPARIEFGALAKPGEPLTYYVRDNGAGFDLEYATKLFGPFQRLHSDAEFPGTGVGLATAARIVHRHGGRIWAESAVDRGATFYFTLEPNT